jgi:hypothetical protein
VFVRVDEAGGDKALGGVDEGQLESERLNGAAVYLPDPRDPVIHEKDIFAPLWFRGENLPVYDQRQNGPSLPRRNSSLAG